MGARLGYTYLEGWKGWSDFESVLLVERAGTVHDPVKLDLFFVIVFSILAAACQLYLGRLTDVDTDLMEVSHFLADDLGHVQVRLRHFPLVLVFQGDLVELS